MLTLLPIGLPPSHFSTGLYNPWDRARASPACSLTPSGRCLSVAAFRAVSRSFSANFRARFSQALASNASAQHVTLLCSDVGFASKKGPLKVVVFFWFAVSFLFLPRSPSTALLPFLFWGRFGSPAKIDYGKRLAPLFPLKSGGPQPNGVPKALPWASGPHPGRAGASTLGLRLNARFHVPCCFRGALVVFGWGRLRICVLHFPATQSEASNKVHIL